MTVVGAVADWQLAAPAIVTGNGAKWVVSCQTGFRFRRNKAAFRQNGVTASNRDLAPKLNNSVRGELEKLHWCLRIAEHPAK